jgi:23S rRNA U2552 (ribose-2'-O)-methylase RlmE/FtsJ
METLFAEKPPWKVVEWVRSVHWIEAPVITYTEWTIQQNTEAIDIKESIGELDKEHKWELAKKMVNPYELVYTHGDERLPPALCLMQPLSRSYFKMVEMLDVLDFFHTTLKGVTKVTSANVAEGPGGFIQAILAIAEHKKKVVTNSFAMTLKPNTSHVPGWRKATAFLLKHKQVKIQYGADGTGDIYKPDNQRAFIENCATGVHIFTADGGFDFSIDYSQQEHKVFHLLLCSITIGLQVLRTGGSFVLKMFDCESIHTKTLICILGRHFHQWTLYKPAMTRPCNSERYFLGRGFRGIIPSIKALLNEMQANSLQGKFPVLPETLWTNKEIQFLQKHIETTTSLQILSIRLAIDLSKDPQKWFCDWKRRCLEKSYSWCEAFRVPAMPLKEHILREVL